MKTVKIFLILLFLCQICCAEEQTVLDFFEQKEISPQDIREADVLLHVHESNFDILKPNLTVGKTIENIWIDEQPVTICNVDFSRCEFLGGCFVDVTFQNVSFEDAVFLPPKNPEPRMLQEGSFCFQGENLNLKNTFFEGKCNLFISGQYFSETRNYELRKTEDLSIYGDFSNTDLRGLRFRSIELTNAQNTQMDGLAFSQEARFHSGITREQIGATWNYRVGIFKNATFLRGCEFPKNVRNFWFADCFIHTSVRDSDFTNAKLIDCTVTSEELTLEQVKSTWNYKTGHMDLCKWPDAILKELEKEKEKTKEGEK